MGARKLSLAAVSLFTLAISLSAAVAQPAPSAGQTFRLCDGLTVYVANDQGQDFKLDLDLYDLNIFAGGPREVMYKVYDPDGKCVLRQFIPDDGVTSSNFPDRLAGWDHELQYYSNLYAKGTNPTIRWSSWSDRARLATHVKRTFQNSFKGAKGVWRVVLVGTPDNYITLRLSPDMKCGLAGNQMWLHGSGKMLAKSHVYIPKGMTGLFVGVAEPDMPRTRNFKITGPDGKVLFDSPANGGFTATEGVWANAKIDFPAGGAYDGKLMTVEVTPGAGDFLIKLTLQQPLKDVANESIGMGSQAVFCPDEQTANAIKGGTTIIDDIVFWHPFQVRYYQWLKANKLENNPELRKELESLFKLFCLLETSDGRGVPTWCNWSYAMGYYGFRVFRPTWLLMARQDVPDDIKAIIREGLIMAGDRLSFAVTCERVNGNAFSQINVALWYCHRATGDAMQKERFELFWDRWKNNEGWGKGVGLSPSGDSQEHFAHDMHYGSYLMDNWLGLQWVKEGGILKDANSAGDMRFQDVVTRYRELYTYLYCREAGPKGAPIAANPWSARTQASAHAESSNWEIDGHTWKGEPGPDFTVNVNGGNEWFAARRKGYYILTYHGRLAPEWLSRCFEGQVGFGAGAICQVTVPGKGPVLASTLNGQYGNGMDPSNWRNFHVHSIVGQLWDGRPLISGISEHSNAKLSGNTVTSSGEVRDAHVKVSRSYTYQPDGIDCSVSLAESDYARVLSIWSHERQWSQVKEAYELIPFMAMNPAGKPTAVTLLDASGKPTGQAAASQPAKADGVCIDRGGFGVKIIFDKPRAVLLGPPGELFIQIAESAAKPVAADAVALKYRIVPFGQ